jgi:RNA polymerase sigma-70 factor (ECF subfamily)
VKDRHNRLDSSARASDPGSTSTGLVEGVRQRLPEAWRRLAHLYGPLVFGWCRRVGLQVRDAEDVLQEVFLTVAARIGDYAHDQPGATFRGWLRTITRNKLGDWLRRHARQEQPAGGSEGQLRLLELTPPESVEGDQADRSELYQRAVALIQAEFEPRSWQAFWRVVVEEANPAEVAAALGMTRNAVYIARSRVLRRLREVLGDA